MTGTVFQFPISSSNITPSIRYGKLFEMNYVLCVKFRLSHLLTADPIIMIPVVIIGDT